MSRPGPAVNNMGGTQIVNTRKKEEKRWHNFFRSLRSLYGIILTDAGTDRLP